MKKKIVIYCVPDMVDSILELKAGAGKVTAHFHGGSRSSMGYIPARLRVENPVMQRVIENSDEFKRGKIRVWDTIEGEVETKSDALAQDGFARVKAEEASEEVSEEAGKTERVVHKCGGKNEVVNWLVEEGLTELTKVKLQKMTIEELKGVASAAGYDLTVG